MKLRALTVVCTLLLGCPSESFQCVDAEQCGDEGACEDNGYCSFPADDCASGRRFGQSAATGIAGQCVPLPEGTTTFESSSTSTSTSTSSSMPTTHATGTGPASTSSTDETTTGVIDPTTTGAASSTSTSTGDASETTSSPVDCAELSQQENSCLVCFQCTEMPMQGCAASAAECDGIAGCREIEGCLSACEAKGICFDDCCEGHDVSAIEAATALSQCHRDECLSPYCADLIEAECSSPL